MSEKISRAPLLDRELPDGYRQEWTDHIGRPTQTVAQGTESVVIFRIAAEWLALPTSVFLGVADPSPTHSLPHRRGDVGVGLVSVQGELIVSISLAAVLGIAVPPAGPTAVAERIMLLGGARGRLACPVSEINGVQRYRRDELAELPATLLHAVKHFSTGLFPWNGRTVARLDEDRLMGAILQALA